MAESRVPAYDATRLVVSRHFTHVRLTPLESTMVG